MPARKTTLTTLRAEIIAVAQALDQAGLLLNKSGNLSCRTERGFLVTPSGVDYKDIRLGEIVELEIDGQPDASGPRPSSEWRLHAAIYAARPGVSAIVHTHSPCATALACAGRGIPAFHYMIALAGGAIRCMPYSTFGSAELAVSAVQGLEGRRATLLANHGVVAVGPSLARARAVAVEVENLAGQYLSMLSAGLEPVVLGDQELKKVIAKFIEYHRLDEPG